MGSVSGAALLCAGGATALVKLVVLLGAGGCTDLGTVSDRGLRRDSTVHFTFLHTSPPCETPAARAYNLTPNIRRIESHVISKRWFSFPYVVNNLLFNGEFLFFIFFKVLKLYC